MNPSHDIDALKKPFPAISHQIPSESVHPASPARVRCWPKLQTTRTAWPEILAGHQG
jgi:hypothetical protein